MKNFISKMENKIKEVVNSLGYQVDSVELIPSSRKEFGDFQYNGVMAIAKSLGKNPRDMANEISYKLNELAEFTNVNVAGPGFINITFTNEALKDYVNELKADISISYEYDSPKTIFLDYGGANVAKALHVGHLRSANIGEAIKRLAKYMNYDVISDVHLGDWGRPLGLVILELKNIHPEWVYFDESFKGEYPDTCPITNEYLEKLYPIASNKANT